MSISIKYFKNNFNLHFMILKCNFFRQIYLDNLKSRLSINIKNESTIYAPSYIFLSVNIL